MRNEPKYAPPGRPMGGRGGHRGPGMPVQKAKDRKGTMKKLISYLKPSLPTIVIVLLFAVIGTICAIVGPRILGSATTEIFEGAFRKAMGDELGIRFDVISGILISLICIYLISAVFSYLQNFLMTGVSMKLTYRLRREISQKMNRLPLKYFDKHTHGEILSRITNDVDVISNSLNQSVTQLITSVTQLLGVLVMMLMISWILTLISILLIPIAMGIVGAVVKRSQKHFVNMQKYLGFVNGHIEEMYDGHNVMRAFNGEAASVRTFDGLNETLYESSWKANFLSGLMMPIMGFAGNLGYVAVCVVGGFLAIGGLSIGGWVIPAIAVGDIQAFIQYVRLFQQPITQAMNIANVFQSTLAAAERVFEFLGEEEEEPDSAAPAHIPAVRGEVTFDHVRFGYNDDRIIINDFSAVVKPGQKIAIVGPTGAGKTTIVKLLMRYYDIQGGSILLDGVNIKDMTREELRDAFGMVLQDTWLFKGSILENIRYGRLDATDEEVMEAAKAAHADHFIKTLPDGFQMELNEESSNISQGQKQLLTIARAFLSNPSVLILDEATSSVDTRTEVRIQRAMEKLTAGRTSFIIAHRLSTIRNADVILVLQDGDIVEQGNHEQLLEKGGVYASLYQAQFETV